LPLLSHPATVPARSLACPTHGGLAPRHRLPGAVYRPRVAVRQPSPATRAS